MNKIRKISKNSHSAFKTNCAKSLVHVRLPLATSRIDGVKLTSRARLIHKAFNDRTSILDAWNELPSLLYESSLEKLIDAKYLSAIRQLNFLQREQSSISTVELYYTWILFHSLYNPASTALISLANFAEFQRSWLTLHESFGYAISWNDELQSFSEQPDEILETCDLGQLELAFHESV